MHALDEDTLASVADAYALGAVTACWPASRGVENRNYFLSCSTGGHERESVRGDAKEYVLTIMQQPAASGTELIGLLEACKSAGLPVPAPLRSRSGKVETALDGQPAIVAPRLGGRHVVNPSTAETEAVGRFLARMHSAADAIAPGLPHYPRTPEWLRSRAADCKPRICWLRRDLLDDALEAVESMLARVDVDCLPTGAIHGDLFRDNVLFDRWGLSGVLDFHHASRGVLLYDLAVAANDWCTEPNGMLDAERLLALLRGYHHIRRLEAAELRFLPAFLLYAALAFWLSRLVVWFAHERDRSSRANDPMPFERIVRARLSIGVPLDPWLVERQNVAASDR